MALREHVITSFVYTWSHTYLQSPTYLLNSAPLIFWYSIWCGPIRIQCRISFLMALYDLYVLRLWILSKITGVTPPVSNYHNTCIGHLFIWKLEPKFGYLVVQERRHSSVIMLSTFGRLLGSLSSAGRFHMGEPCSRSTCHCWSRKCTRQFSGIEICYHWRLCIWFHGMPHSRSSSWWSW